MYINSQRLLADLTDLRRFGAKGKGVVRPAFSKIDMESRIWLQDRFADAGLQAVIDGVGNVIGQSRQGGPAILIGSHTDTQPEGGWLDGALGVIYGLEIARTLSENPGTSHLAIDVASWMDEEGTYLSCLGSRSFCNVLGKEEIAGNRPLTTAIQDAGLAEKPTTRLDPARHMAYIEAHIEQGPWLESTGKRIGIVTGIVGLQDISFRFDGQQNHAGSTPMVLRCDAAAAMIDLAARINDEFPDILSDTSVWTIGALKLDTASPSIIPGGADMCLQFRDQDQAVLIRAEAHIEKLVLEANQSGPVRISVIVDEDIAPAPMDSGLQRHLADAARQQAQDLWQYMPSGAVHDAQIFASRIPTAMLFIPSIGGISHSFDEDTNEADIVLGCQVMANAIVQIMTEKMK